MASHTVTYRSSGTLPALLTVLFVGLKLTGYISWSWWWVLSPLWLPAAILLGMALVALVLFLVWFLIWGRKNGYRLRK